MEMNLTSQTFPSLKRFFVRLHVLFWVLAMTGCAGYRERVAPIPLPESQPRHVRVEGVDLFARDFLDRKEAKQAFGFDVRGAGLLPVQVVIDNRGPQEIAIVPEHTFLIDPQGRAWPLLTAEQAYERTKSHLELGETAKKTLKPAVLLGSAGALAGLAIGVLTGENVGEAAGKGAVLGAAAGAIIGGATGHEGLGDTVREDLANRSLRNRAIEPGALAHGFLFFPGLEEAASVHALRLEIQMGPEKRLVHLPLGPEGEGAAQP